MTAIKSKDSQNGWKLHTKPTQNFEVSLDRRSIFLSSYSTERVDPQQSLVIGNKV